MLNFFPAAKKKRRTRGFNAYNWLQTHFQTLTERPAPDAIPGLITEWMKDQRAESRKKKILKLGPEQFAGALGFVFGKQVHEKTLSIFYCMCHALSLTQFNRETHLENVVI